MALVPDNKMVLCDFNNNQVKLVDLKSGRLVSSLRLSAQPWDMCAIPGRKVAVTLPFKDEIQVISTQEQLQLTTCLKTRLECKGISYWQDTLIVTFRDGVVQKMDMRGNVVMEIDNTKAEYELCPLYVTVDNKGSALYVSDAGEDTITKMDLTIKEVAKIENKAIEEPRGMFPLDDHHLLVCSFDSHSVVLVNTETQEVRELIGPDQGIRWPYCVSYSAELGKLYITQVGNYVKVFDMKYSL